jgi:hypothetical protein
MNCKQIRERLLAAQYGELPTEEQALVETHLAECAACRQESAGWQEFRGALGEFTGPAVQVDLPALYRQAVLKNEQRTRRWRRSAIAAAAVAAVVLLAVGLKLQVRVDRTQIAMGWGAGAAVDSPTGKIDERDSQLRGLGDSSPPGQGKDAPVSQEDLTLVKNLIRALAQDVRSRDRQQREALLAMQTRIEYLLGQTTEYVAANERDKAVLAAQFRIQKKGEHQ